MTKASPQASTYRVMCGVVPARALVVLICSGSSFIRSLFSKFHSLPPGNARWAQPVPAVRRER